MLLGLNGLRVSEACETNVEDLAVERGHRILRITGKGNKPAAIPLVPRTARTIDLAVGERHEGPIFRRRDGQRLDRRTARTGGCARLASELASGTCTRTCCGRRSSWPLSTPACPCETCRWRPGTPLHEPIHANDLWIVASAVHIGAPLLTADAVFDRVPGLALYR